MFLRFHRITIPVSATAAACALLASCGKSSKIGETDQQPKISAGEIKLIVELAERLDPDEAIARLTQRIEQAPGQADEFFSSLHQTIDRTNWVVEESAIQTGFAIEQLWSDDSSLWVALNDNGQHSAFRWDLSSNQTTDVLFPSPGAPVYSWHFSPDSQRVLIERGERLLLCDARSLQPIRELPPLPPQVLAASVISFTQDSLLFSHATQSEGGLAWQIRESANGELLRSEWFQSEDANFVAGNLTRNGLHLLQGDGSFLTVPLNPVEPPVFTASRFDGELLLVLPTPNDEFLCLVHHRRNPETRVVRLGPGKAIVELPEGVESWERLAPWSRLSSFSESPFAHPSLQPPLSNPSLAAACMTNTRVFAADTKGMLVSYRRLPPRSESSTGLPYEVIPQSSIATLQQHQARLSLEHWSTILDATPHSPPPNSILLPVRERLRVSRSTPSFPAIEEAFSNGDREAIRALIQSAAPSGEKAAACLAAALRSPKSEWIFLCLESFPDMPDLLARIAKTRIAWLEGKQAEAISLWPGEFPNYQTVRETNDWKGWESEDFRVSFEHVRQTIREVIDGYRIHEDSTPKEREEIYARFMNPSGLQSLGKERFIELCLDAAKDFAAYPEDASKTLELAKNAKILGAPTAPCLRAEALAFTAMGEHASARTRWINLISYHPVSDHEPGDYTEAAYSAYENHDTGQAMAFLATGTHRYPDDADLALRAAWIALLIGHPESAWRFLIRGQQVGFPEEKVPHSFALFAIASMQSGAPDESAAYHEELIRLDPTWKDPGMIDELGWPEEFHQTLLHLAGNSPLRQDHSPGPEPTNHESSQ